MAVALHCSVCCQTAFPFSTWCSIALSRLQMSLHRLLQRGLAALYGYKLPEVSTSRSLDVMRWLVPFGSTNTETEKQADKDVLDEAIQATSSKELNFKMQGVRFTVASALTDCWFCQLNTTHCTLGLAVAVVKKHCLDQTNSNSFVSKHCRVRF